jgi:hypothetical protein
LLYMWPTTALHCGSTLITRCVALHGDFRFVGLTTTKCFLDSHGSLHTTTSRRMAVWRRCSIENAAAVVRHQRTWFVVRAGGKVFRARTQELSGDRTAHETPLFLSIFKRPSSAFAVAFTRRVSTSAWIRSVRMILNLDTSLGGRLQPN